MNKKITLYYFLIALMVMVIISINDSSHAAPVSAKLDVDNILAFWTPERIKSAKPLIYEKTGFRNKTSGTKKVKITADDDDDDDQRLSMPPFDNPNDPSNYPVGILL